MILAVIRRESEEKATIFYELYRKGLTTEQIGEVAEIVFSRHYSKQHVSCLTTRCKEDVEAWLSRRLSKQYLVVYIDATYVSTRRDGSVSNEGYYTILDMLPSGKREVLSVVNHPTERA